MLYAFLAALFAAISNFCLRKSIDAGGSSKAYLVVQLTFSFVIMVLMNPVRTQDFGYNGASVILGLCGGVLLGLLMWGLGKTLEKGPPGLSFAVLNTSSIMPAILLFLLFGTSFGHSYDVANGIGSFLVTLGLFWAGWTSEKSPHKIAWMCFAVLIFLVHTFFLVFLQWWAMILKTDLPPSRFLPFHLSSDHIQWFMPAIFFVAALIQWVIFLASRHPLPKSSEFTYGIFGGLCQGACTFFLILAPQVAADWQNALIFPLFSVGVIILSNAWAQLFYKERVNWLANLLCLGGLLVSTLC
jgi:uncharacterized membrane protein